MILIDKKLTTPNGLEVPAGSVIEFTSIVIQDMNRISMIHWLNKEKKFMPINKVNEFEYVTFTDSNSEIEVKEYIDSKIGEMFTKII